MSYTSEKELQHIINNHSIITDDIKNLNSIYNSENFILKYLINVLLLLGIGGFLGFIIYYLVTVSITSDQQ